MIYHETSTCPVCKTKTRVAINVSGDYDGQDKPWETNPRECLKCDGIKVVSPEIHKMLMDLWDRLTKQRDSIQENENKLRRELYGAGPHLRVLIV
jgi:hypothetical protein